MKKIVLLGAFLFSVAFGAAQVPRHLDPQAVAIGKELPRGPLVSLDSLGQGADRVPRYLQMLEDWERSETPDAVVYATSFRVPFEWMDRRQLLCLQKVSASFDVVVNGQLAGYSQAGSLPTEFDLTDVAREGVNELEVVVYRESIAAEKLENGRRAVEPQILGPVCVFSQPLLRVRDIVVDSRTEGTAGLLELGVVMKSHRLNEQSYVVLFQLIGDDGRVLAWERKQATVDMRREDTVRFFANVRDIEPWMPERPRTYELRIETRQDGRVKERLAFEIGFRSANFRDGQVFVNGRPVRMPARGLPAESEKPGELICPAADIDTHLSGTSRRVGGNPSNDPAWVGAYVERALASYHLTKRDPRAVAFSLASGPSANGICLYESYLALKALERGRPIVYLDSKEWNSDL